MGVLGGSPQRPAILVGSGDFHFEKKNFPLQGRSAADLDLNLPNIMAMRGVKRWTEVDDNGTGKPILFSIRKGPLRILDAVQSAPPPSDRTVFKKLTTAQSSRQFRGQTWQCTGQIASCGCYHASHRAADIARASVTPRR
ncbi:hypothetical protein [Pseudooceanicola sp.]|uniref:hypothetical protein n=1 Tax=Pseudooceanicola sp. TaxID=1914328 RepID=UPI0035C6F01D